MSMWTRLPLLAPCCHLSFLRDIPSILFVLRFYQMLRISHQEEMATDLVSNYFKIDTQPLYYLNTLDTTS